MHPHLPASFLLFLWTFTFFFDAPISFAEEPDPQYQACNRAFDCGDISDVFYPFWGGPRPDYCGLPGFQLRCEDNSAVIDMKSVPHRVVSINRNNLTMVIARLDLWGGPCTENYINTTLNQSPFSSSSSNGNLALFYNCSGVSTFPIPGIPFPNKFSCTNGNGEQSDANYFAYGEYISTFGEAADNYECRHNIEVPVRNMSLETLKRKEELPTVLKGGFVVDYDIKDTINHCLECMVSEGMCGRRNSTSQEPVCFCRDRPYQNTCPASSRPGSTWKRKLIVAPLFLTTGFLGAAGAAIIVAFIFLFPCLRSFGKKAMENKNVEEFLRNYGSVTPKRYSYSDIKSMTDSFKEKLGQGGYGSVYKGKLRDGSPVAVKFLKELKGNGEEFINEVASISRTSHVNIVTLLGFCFDGQKRALIYEFMPNGSLEKFIYDKKPLTSDRRLGWEALHQIATGIARGLEYLHRGCNTRILHFDIKPHNILLDEELCPKISDFGLAKLCTRKESAISMLAARGTVGYIAPEVFSRQFGHVSHKSDVYSYGMMVLEMVGVRNNTGQATGNTSDEYFPHWIYRHLNLSGHLALHGISTEKDDEIARKMVLVGLWCIQTNPSDRPSISKVLEMLEGDLESLPIPPKPFLSSPPRSPASSPTRSTSSKQSTVL